MQEELMKRQAAAWAKATTSARCARVGECDKCGIKHCDYRSRYNAYIQGWTQCSKNHGYETDKI